MSDAPDRPVLEARGLVRRFREGDGRIDVLRGVDLEVSAGARLAIVGASGSGKSTLMHLLGGLDAADGGEVFWDGRAVATMGEKERARQRNVHLGFVYQLHHLLAEFTALENAAMPLLIRGVAASEAESSASGLLERVGLAQRLDHRPAELSGGERQRVAIARALAGEPRVLLADEPTGNLDARTAAAIVELLLDLNRETGTALVVVTHDASLADRMDSRVSLVDGVLVPAS